MGNIQRFDGKHGREKQTTCCALHGAYSRRYDDFGRLTLFLSARNKSRSLPRWLDETRAPHTAFSTFLEKELWFKPRRGTAAA